MIGGLLVANCNLWAVVGRGTEEFEALLEEDPAEAVPLCLCRAILDGGVLILGAADPTVDRLLSAGDDDEPSSEPKRHGRERG